MSTDKLDLTHIEATLKLSPVLTPSLLIYTCLDDKYPEQYQIPRRHEV